jgi:hypothetical protein
LLERLYLREDNGDSPAWSAPVILRILGSNVLHDNFIGHVVLKINELADGILSLNQVRIFRQW